MPQNLHIVCPHCHTINRVPNQRIDHHPVCGRCKQQLFTGHPVELNQGNFDRHTTQSDLPVVVDFWAPWCAPCRAMAPVFAQAAARLEPRVRLAKVDTEQEQSIAYRFAIRSIPTVAIFSGGREIARQAGAMDLSSLLAWVGKNVT